MIIYLDMDDVVADWYTYAQALLGITWDRADNYRIPQDQWQRLTEDERFYLDLPIKEGAYDLVNWCKAYCTTNPGTELRFLSALPHDYSMPYAANDKVLWAQRHFPGIPVFIGPFSHDKWRHCQPGDVLIDDRHPNCLDWKNAGGRSHIYTDWPTCEKWLLETLINDNISQ